MEKLHEVPEIVTVSSKGQIVIPKDIREELHIKAGSVFAVANPFEDTVVLKKIKNPILKEDLELLKNIEEAWEEVERGECITKSKEEFLKDLDRWVNGGEL